MPELPEVTTTARELNKVLPGRIIKDAWTDWNKMFKRPAGFEPFKKLALGRKFIRVWRIGKNVLFDLDQDLLLLIHQKISGHLLYGQWSFEAGKWQPRAPKTLIDPQNRFIHFKLDLDNGCALALSDQRKFGKVLVGPKDEILKMRDLRVGPDALEITLEELTARLKKRALTIKQALLNQEIVAGIGNIYSDEILWLARINPRKRAARLARAELARLHDAIPKILNEAIRLKGTSDNDYRRPTGARGSYQDHLKVYRRDGEPCPRCGTVIKSFKAGARTGRYCPVCQK